MSSFRNAAPRRTHRERGQLIQRERLGLLEKHKDYVERAKNFHSKETRLTALKEKARFKNQDEFYFAMQSSKTKNGIHIMKGPRDKSIWSADMMKLLKTQDISYISNQLLLERNKVQELEERHSWLRLANNEADEKKERNHHIFLETDDQTEDTQYFPFILSNQSVNTLKSPSMNIDDGIRQKILQEYQARVKRIQDMRHVEKELRLKFNLTKPGRRHVIGTEANDLPIYKWNNQRSK